MPVATIAGYETEVAKLPRPAYAQNTSMCFKDKQDGWVICCELPQDSAINWTLWDEVNGPMIDRSVYANREARSRGQGLYRKNGLGEGVEDRVK
jgi:hypothetical protein